MVWGRTNEWVVSINLGCRAEAMFIETLETEGCGSLRWRKNIYWLGAVHAFVAASKRAELCSWDQGLRTS